MTQKRELLRAIPKVDEIIDHKSIKEILSSVSRNVVMDVIRRSLEQTRTSILSLEDLSEKDFEKVDIDVIVEKIVLEAKREELMNLRRVINATGVILHTNLGRALLPECIKDQVWETASNYSTLEYNVKNGLRGSRYDHIDGIITKLLKCEAALVVNNNAAAVLLILSTLAKGKQVIVSRGELVEIGGSFRVPEIMAQGGAELVEVGTTNKTKLRDYENAISEEKTGALLKVHTSNYRILGFTEEVPLSELSELGNKYNIPVVHDLGSGAMIDFAKFGIHDEETVLQSVNSGADIVCFSGDKLLGGPQAGIIIGKKKYIEMMKKNPLTRAFRIDKLTLAALEATLRLYFDDEKAIREIPLISMMTMPIELLEERADFLCSKINREVKEITATLEEGFSQVGGGSMPLQELPTKLIRIKPLKMSVQQLEGKLRGGDVPLIVRVHKDHIYMDVRTIKLAEFDEIIEILKINLDI